MDTNESEEEQRKEEIRNTEETTAHSKMTGKKSIYKPAAVIGFLVKTLRVKHPEKQISPAHIQRIGYFLKRKNLQEFKDFKYAMSPDGPFSGAVSVELSTAISRNIVKMIVKKNGWFLEPGKNFEKMVVLLSDDEKDIIRETVNDKVGDIGLKELSEEATKDFWSNSPLSTLLKTFSHFNTT